LNKERTKRGKGKEDEPNDNELNLSSWAKEEENNETRQEEAAQIEKANLAWFLTP
jgi:hypothetical protein